MKYDAPIVEQRPGGKVTLRTLARMSSRAEPFACVAAYDATTARWCERGGIHLIIVGDSAAEIVLGFDWTRQMPLDVAIALTAGVKRGAPNTVIMGDMPFMSYHCGVDDAVRNAGRFMTEGLADIVKLEADASFAPLVERMSRAGIPVCAHVGSLPQHAAMSGGYGSAGRTADEAWRIVQDAVALERAGAVMLLIEAVPDEVTELVMKHTRAPLIGIGAGTACHGQVLVLHDLLGMTDAPPRFAERVDQLGDRIRNGAGEWVARVARREIGGRRYDMPPEERARLNELAANPTPREA
ncbi:MAG: 3-methyl-2-oxobutanoate hydroxymethyltransferase [Phycisphaerales bacterium]|nr:3-methyl-2-oxobutanoate hydroxymethyltransferase [Phycisphaerales bacterium]